MDKNIAAIRIILWLILVLSIGFFAYMKICPSGAISYVHDFSGQNYFIGKLSPEERVELRSDEVEIKGDPVYFSLATPRRFERAKITVKFKNTTDFPIMEIGLLNDKNSWNYDLKPLQNKIMDQLYLAWHAISDKNGTILAEREKKYGSVSDFLSNLPPKNEMALYHYDLKAEFALDEYEPSPESSRIGCKLRGSYQFYTYIKNEWLDFVFDFSDLNINADDDPVAIKIYSKQAEIYATLVEDDKKENLARRANIKIPDLPEGVYRFSIIANDDIITESITSRQSRFVLKNKAWLAGNKENTVLFTDSRIMNVQAMNPASVGKIKIGGDFLDISEPYRQFSMKIQNRAARIELPKSDVIISGDGVFGFAQDELFNPAVKSVDANLGINAEKINYVLADYKTPADFEDWRVASAEFDLTRAYREKGKYKFLISVPGMKAENSHSGEVAIKEIKIDLAGISLVEKIKRYYAE